MYVYRVFDNLLDVRPAGSEDCLASVAPRTLRVPPSLERRADHASPFLANYQWEYTCQ